MKNVVFLEAPEIKTLAEKLKERYYVYIGYVDLEQIFFAEMVGFTPRKAKPIALNGLAQKWVRDLLLSDTRSCSPIFVFQIKKVSKGCFILISLLN
jgi:hypothetical protein